MQKNMTILSCMFPWLLSSVVSSARVFPCKGPAVAGVGHHRDDIISERQAMIISGQATGKRSPIFVMLLECPAHSA